MSQETFNERFSRLINNPDVFTEMARQARKNEQHFRELEEKWQTEPEKMKVRQDLYKSFSSKDKGNIYILPQDVDMYIRYLTKTAYLFREKSPFEAIDSGADIIFEYGFEVYIDRLEEALKQGRRITVNVCFDIFRYVLQVVYNRIVAAESQDFQESFQTRMESIFKIVEQLIEDIDHYYENLTLLEIGDSNYKQAKLAWDRKREEIEETFSLHLCQQMVNWDIKDFRQQVVNADVQQYFSVLLNAKMVYEQFNTESIITDVILLELEQLRNSINEMLAEFKEMFVSGDEIACAKALEEINARNMKRMQELEKKRIDQCQQINNTIEKYYALLAENNQ